MFVYCIIRCLLGVYACNRQLVNSLRDHHNEVSGYGISVCGSGKGSIVGNYLIYVVAGSQVSMLWPL